MGELGSGDIQNSSEIHLELSWSFFLYEYLRRKFEPGIAIPSL